MERTISHYCPMKLQKVCMYILLCCSGAILMSKLQPYGAVEESTNRSVKTLGIVAGPVHITAKKEVPVGVMDEAPVEPIHDDSRDQVVEEAGTRVIPLNVEGRLFLCNFTLSLVTYTTSLHITPVKNFLSLMRTPILLLSAHA